MTDTRLQSNYEHQYEPARRIKGFTTNRPSFESQTTVVGNYLTYPHDLAQDYVRIHISEYRSRSQTRNRSGADQRMVGGPPLAIIKLPVPDLPNMVSQQKYGQISGALNNLLASGLGEAYNEIDNAVSTGQQPDQGRIGAIADRLRQQATNQGGPVIRELAGAAAGAIAGITGPQFQTLAQGQISNPGIELLYGGPTLRSFTMNWTLAPKDANEAETVREIIRVLKYHHLPSGTVTGGMLKVPDVFEVSVHINGTDGRHYQKYFMASLEALSVKQNSAGQHLTLPGGEPVVTTISCVWKEIEITTRESFVHDI